MLLTITKVTQEFTKTGAEYRKIIGTTDDSQETTKSVFDNLKFLWPLLVEGKEIELKLVKKGQFWNVINIKNADEPWPENTDMVANDEVVKKAEEPKAEPPPKPAIAETKDRDGLPLSVKIRTFTTSYSKDLATSGIIGPDEILSYAKAFEGYIWDKLIVKDDDVFRRAISHAKFEAH